MLPVAEQKPKTWHLMPSLFATGLLGKFHSEDTKSVSQVASIWRFIIKIKIPTYIFKKKKKNCSNCEETQRTIFHINNLKVSPGNNNVAISNTLKMEDLKPAILNLPDSFG